MSIDNILYNALSFSQTAAERRIIRPSQEDRQKEIIERYNSLSNDQLPIVLEEFTDSLFTTELYQDQAYLENKGEKLKEEVINILSKRIGPEFADRARRYLASVVNKIIRKYPKEEEYTYTEEEKELPDLGRSLEEEFLEFKKEKSRGTISGENMSTELDKISKLINAIEEGSPEADSLEDIERLKDSIIEDLEEFNSYITDVRYLDVIENSANQIRGHLDSLEKRISISKQL